MTSSRKITDYEFQIQFSGRDMPGLLSAFTTPLAQNGFNVTDIALATGGQLHTTFISCRLHNESSTLGKNRWHDCAFLKATLTESVNECHLSFFNRINESPPAVEPMILIEPQGLENRHNKAFLIHLIFKVASQPGHLCAIAEELSDSFTITATFDWPDEDARQTVYMQTRHIPTLEYDLSRKSEQNNGEIEGEERSLKKLVDEFFALSTSKKISTSEHQIEAKEDLQDLFTELRLRISSILKDTYEKMNPIDVGEDPEIDAFYIQFDEGHKFLSGMILDDSGLVNPSLPTLKDVSERIDRLEKKLIETKKALESCSVETSKTIPTGTTNLNRAEKWLGFMLEKVEALAATEAAQ